MGVTTKKVFTDQTVRSYIVRATIAFETEAPLVVTENEQGIAWRQGDLVGVRNHPDRTKRQIYVLGAKGSYEASPTQFPLIKANLGYEQVPFSKVRVLEGTEVDFMYDLMTVGRLSTTDNLAEMVWSRGGVSQDDVITQQKEASNYFEVANEAERLALVFGDTLQFEGDDVEVKKGLVVQELEGDGKLYTLIDTIVSSPASWQEISNTSLDAFLELLIEQPTPVINPRNLALAQDNVWIGDQFNKPVSNPVGITLIGSASLVAGTITIEDDLITPESIVTLSPTTTGTFTGILRYTVTQGQVVVESRNNANALINTDTVTFGFNIETGVNDTVRKSKYIIVNDPVTIEERSLAFSAANQQFLRTKTSFPQFSKSQAFTIMIDCNVSGTGGIFYSADNISSSIFRGIRITSSEGTIGFTISVNGTNGDMMEIRSNSAIGADGIFHFTYDGSNTVAGMAIYKNNVLIASSSVGAGVLTGDINRNNLIYIARRNAINGSFQTGVISSIGIVDYVQDSTERAADVAARFQTASSGTSLFNLDLKYPTQIKTLNTVDINTPLPNPNALLTTDANEYQMEFLNFPTQLVLGTNLV